MRPPRPGGSSNPSNIDRLSNDVWGTALEVLGEGRVDVVLRDDAGRRVRIDGLGDRHGITPWFAGKRVWLFGLEATAQRVDSTVLAFTRAPFMSCHAIAWSGGRGRCKCFSILSATRYHVKPSALESRIDAGFSLFLTLMLHCVVVRHTGSSNGGYVTICVTILGTLTRNDCTDRAWFDYGVLDSPRFLCACA